MDDAQDGLPPFIYSLFLFSMSPKANQSIYLMNPIDFPHKVSVMVNEKSVSKFCSRGHDGPTYIPIDLMPYIVDSTGFVSTTKHKVTVSFEIASKTFLIYPVLVKNFTLPTIFRTIVSSTQSYQSADDVKTEMFKNADGISATVTLGLKCPLLI